jgi:uncharacterized protein (TIGR03118 family)
MKFVTRFAVLFAFLASFLLVDPFSTFAQHYTQTNLTSDISSLAPVNDPNLQNAWGLVHGPTTPWWISDNNSGVSTLYNGAGQIISLPTPTGGVVVPNAPSQQPPGSPTGIMFNGSSTDFLLAPNAPAVFIWVTEDGTISGWNPSVDIANAKIEVDNSQFPTKTDGAVYKGGTIVEMDGNKFILAANFRSGRIDIFDTNFKPVHLHNRAFDDDRIPQDFAPFNVQGIGSNIYVTYAKQDAAKHDDVAGDGLGFVAVFSNEGRLLQILQHGQWLNAPWGVVLTPADFGEFSHTLLVGNFGNGTIAAFNPLTGRFIGNVLNPDDSTLQIDGLWALAFGNGGNSGPGNTLFFTAGPNAEKDGLFGTLTPIASELGEDDEQ